MATKVRGDYELEDLAQQLVSKLNALRVHHLKLPPFDSELKQLLADCEFLELWRRLVDESAVLFKGDPKEVVDVYNVVFELLDTIDKDADAPACHQLAEKIIKIVTEHSGDASAKAAPATSKQASPGGGATPGGGGAGGGGGSNVAADVRLAVLANLYNAAFISDFAELRFTVLRALVRFAGEHKRVGTIESFLAGTTPLLASIATAPLAVQRATLLDIYGALHAYGRNPALEQTFLIKYLATFEGEQHKAEVDLPVLKLACTAIGAAIGNVLAAQGRQLVKLQAVQLLAKAGGSRQHLFKLLTIFNDGQLPDYIAFHKDHPSVLAEFGVDHEKAVRSMRLLSLCTACSSATDGQLDYSTAAKALGFEKSENEDGEVEAWAMLAIKNGLLDLKMCQQTKKITVYSSTQRNFQTAQWAEMKAKLTRWKLQVHKLLVTVKGVSTAVQRRPR